MSYTVNTEKTYEQSYADTYKAAQLSIKAMKGKILEAKPEKNHLKAQMDKKLYGKYLGDRSHLIIEFVSDDENTTTLKIEAYPVNPIGQPLMFGAREGVIPRVLEALYNEMGQRLSEGVR